MITKLSTTITLDTGARLWVTCTVFAGLVMNIRARRISSDRDVTRRLTPHQYVMIEAELRRLASPHNLERAKARQLKAYHDAIAQERRAAQEVQPCRAVA